MSLVFCSINKNLKIEDHFHLVDDIFINEIELEDTNRMKDEVKKIVSSLKETALYSGEELEFTVVILNEILTKLNLVIETFDKTGYGIDLLNIKKVINDYKHLK